MISKPDLLHSLEHLLALRTDTLPMFLLDIADTPRDSAAPDPAPECHALLAQAQRQRVALEQLLSKIGDSDQHDY